MQPGWPGHNIHESIPFEIGMQVPEEASGRALCQASVLLDFFLPLPVGGCAFFQSW